LARTECQTRKKGKPLVRKGKRRGGQKGDISPKPLKKKRLKENFEFYLQRTFVVERKDEADRRKKNPASIKHEHRQKTPPAYASRTEGCSRPGIDKGGDAQSTAANRGKQRPEMSLIEPIKRSADNSSCGKEQTLISYERTSRRGKRIGDTKGAKDRCHIGL